MSSRESDRTSASAEDIAIVGMSCMFPGADNLADYWQNIVHKVDCITDPPPDWQPELFLDPTGCDPDRVYTGKGGYLGDLCRFDPLKYGVMPSSVEGAEPDHFIALKCAFDAMADAGYPELPLNTERTGVIMGRGTYANRGYFALLQHGFVVDQVVRVLRQIDSNFDESQLDLIRQELKRNLPPSNGETAPGVSHCILVGRIANRLDLHGPSYTLDAACASSLLAIEHGMRELRAGTCDAVLAGGVQVSTCALVSLIFCHLQALSRAGRIAPLSADANGTLLGSGCGVVVLKRRSDAERDGNRIYAVLKAVGVASDGKGAGLLAPVSEGQQLAMRRAYEQAGLSPSTVDLVEAHATGIMLGDSIEIESLTATFGERTEQKPVVALGSVKSQIGHLIPAAGSAAIIKTALSLYHGVLPPTLRAETQNPALNPDRTPFYVSNEPRPWIHGESLRRAGINAFGFGGIDAHALIEEHATPASIPECLERDWPLELVVVSAPDRAALQTRVEALAEWVDRAHGVSLLDIAAACAEDLQASRVSICAKDLEELVKKLRRVAEMLADPDREKIQDRSGVFWYETPLAKDGRLAFVFPGEGSQYVNMLADVCRQFPEARRQFDLTDRAFASLPRDQRPSRWLFPLPGEEQLAATELFGLEWAVEVVAAANRALFDVIKSLGVKPDTIIGHSSGELVALWASGAIDIDSEEDLARCIALGSACTREIMDRDLVPPGVLTAVGGVGIEPVLELVEASNGRLVVAMDNCPHQLVIAGDEADSSKAVDRLRRQGAICQRFPWDRKYHTEEFAPACEALDRYIRALRLRAPGVELWSCASAERYPSSPEQIHELAVAQWRSPVRFRETIEAMYETGVRLFVEVGPRGNLSSFVSDTLKGRPHAAIPLNVARRGGLEQLAHALGQLAAHGVAMDLGSLYRRRRPKPIDLLAAPPETPRPDPVLRLDLPELKLSEEVLRKVHARNQASPRAAASPAPEPALPAEASLPAEAPLPPRVDRSRPAIAPTPKNQPSSPGRARALADHQRTMRKFLETQKTVMTRLVHGTRRPGRAHADNVPSLVERYRANPQSQVFTRDLSGGFPASDSGDFTVCETAAFGEFPPVGQSPSWLETLATLVLGSEERAIFQNLDGFPHVRASWVLGRAAVKDAVRLHLHLTNTMADVTVVERDTGGVDVRPPRGGPLRVSLSHSGCRAVAVAADADLFAGVGIDLEPVRSLDQDFIIDAFSSEEREIVESAARGRGDAEDVWYLSAWGAKEAAGKALGTGVLGGPRSIRIETVDPRTTRWTLAVEGATAAACRANGLEIAGLDLVSYTSASLDRVTTLCLLKRTERQKAPARLSTGRMELE